MKDNVMRKIANTPLSFPYFDMDDLRAVEPMDLRFKVAMFEVSNAVKEKYNVDEDRVPEFILAQYQAGKYVAQKIKEKGMQNTEVSEKSGMDVTSVSKMINGKRPFSPNSAYLTPFCYNIMGESCHKIMFGEEGKVILPSVYAELAKAMTALNEDQKDLLLNKAKVQYALFEKQNRTGIANAPMRGQSTIISERIYEMLYDKGQQGYQFFGPDTPYQIRGTLKQFLLDDYKKETPRIGFVMYLAFETGVALDYFIAEDFTRFAPCFYRNKEDLVEVKDRKTLKYIGICAAMPPIQRQNLIGEAIGLHLSASFA